MLVVRIQINLICIFWGLLCANARLCEGNFSNNFISDNNKKSSSGNTEFHGWRGSIIWWSHQKGSMTRAGRDSVVRTWGKHFDIVMFILPIYNMCNFGQLTALQYLHFTICRVVLIASFLPTSRGDVSTYWILECEYMLIFFKGKRREVLNRDVFLALRIVPNKV